MGQTIDLATRTKESKYMAKGWEVLGERVKALENTKNMVEEESSILEGEEKEV